MTGRISLSYNPTGSVDTAVLQILCTYGGTMLSWNPMISQTLMLHSVLMMISTIPVNAIPKRSCKVSIRRSEPEK